MIKLTALTSFQVTAAASAGATVTKTTAVFDTVDKDALLANLATLTAAAKEARRSSDPSTGQHNASAPEWDSLVRKVAEADVVLTQVPCPEREVPEVPAEPVVPPVDESRVFGGVAIVGGTEADVRAAFEAALAAVKEAHDGRVSVAVSKRLTLAREAALADLGPAVVTVRRPGTRRPANGTPRVAKPTFEPGKAANHVCIECSAKLPITKFPTVSGTSKRVAECRSCRDEAAAARKVREARVSAAA